MKYESKFKLGQKVYYVEGKAGYSSPWPFWFEKSGCDENNKAQQKRCVGSSKIWGVSFTKKRRSKKVVVGYNEGSLLFGPGLEEKYLYASLGECLKANLKEIKSTIKKRRLEQEKRKKKRLKEHLKEHRELVLQEEK